MTAASTPRLQFVGSGDAFGNGGRFQTCLHLSAGTDGLLIDCGASSLTALKTAGIEPNDIEWLLLTHLHADHFGGIPFLVLDGQFRRRERPLTIAGPLGTRERTEAAMEVMFPGSAQTERRFPVQWVELADSTPTTVGPALVSAFAIELPDTPACSLRVEYAGRVVAYTGDTAWTDRLIALAHGADLLVAEAYFFDREVPFHLAYKTLYSHRAQLDCRRIVLTHMSPDMLSRQSEAEFECAYDGMVVDLE